MMDDRKPTSREDDFRDYEQRDIRDGWPYADRDGGGNVPRNDAYGRSEANFDHLDDSGVDVASDPAKRKVSGEPTLVSLDTEEVIADDDLEARISDALEDDERIDAGSLEINIRNGIAHLDGAVDSEDDRRYLVERVRRIKGVRNVHADAVVTRGVDSHIPRDAYD